ncbi:MAG TPA: glycosyltransferase [Hyphomicrobiaceae bacterium]|nr:glycosyltransferase [Hyphomicrobiaceae bacterium]
MSRQPVHKPPVVIVTLTLDVGGTEQHIATVAPLLVERGWPVSVYCLNRAGEQAELLRSRGVDVIAPPREAAGRQTPRAKRAVLSTLAAADLFRKYRRQKPAIAHTFLTEPFLFAGPAGILARVPIRVMSRRELKATRTNWPGARAVERRLIARMAAVLGNSRSVVAELIEDGAPRDRIGLIYNGIDVRRFSAGVDRERLRRDLGIAGDGRIAIMVANLFPYKGQRELIEGFASVAASLPEPWTLVLVGRDEGDRAHLEARIAALGVGDRVRLVGQRKDVPSLLAASDIGIHASRQEGFSNAVLEQMATGLPVIVTEAGGNTDAVTHDKTGLIVPIEAPEALAAAISTLARDPARRTRLGAAARARIEKEFTLARVVDAYEALYMGLLAGRRPAEIEGVGIGR